MIFNNGSKRVAAAEKFLLWMTAAPQATAFSLATGDLPIRKSVEDSAGFLAKMDTALPGVDTFVSNLANVKQARPQTPSYPKVSSILGQMIVSVLLEEPARRCPGHRRAASQRGAGERLGILT